MKNVAMDKRRRRVMAMERKNRRKRLVLSKRVSRGLVPEAASQAKRRARATISVNSAMQMD